MNGASEFQIAAEPDSQMIKPAFQRPDRHHVGQRLCRMLMTSVACVDHRNRRFHRRDQRRALLGMPHCADVGEAGNDADRIGDRLSLRNRRGVRAVEAERLASEIHHRRLKAEARPRARLIEQSGDLLSFTCVTVFLRMFLDVAGKIQQYFCFLHRKVERAHQMSWCHYASYSSCGILVRIRLIHPAHDILLHPSNQGRVTDGSSLRR